MKVKIETVCPATSNHCISLLDTGSFPDSMSHYVMSNWSHFMILQVTLLKAREKTSITKNNCTYVSIEFGKDASSMLQRKMQCNCHSV